MAAFIQSINVHLKQPVPLDEDSVSSSEVADIAPVHVSTYPLSDDPRETDNNDSKKFRVHRVSLSVRSWNRGLFRNTAGLGQVSALGISLFFGGIAFALLHGVRSIAFLLFAVAFTLVVGGLLFTQHTGLLAGLAIPVTFGATVGIHRGNDIGESDGLSAYYGQILQAPEPVSYVSWAVIGWDLITAIAAIVFVLGLIGLGFPQLKKWLG